MKHSLELFEQPIPAMRAPTAEDGKTIAALAQRAEQEVVGELLGALAEVGDFGETSIIAELNGEVVGAVLAYVLPYDPQTLFIWQVTVAEGEEGKGLASLMLGQLMRRDACADVTRVQTAIPSSDEHAWTLFRRFAHWQRTRMDIQPFVTQALKPHRRHENDNLVTIHLHSEARQAV
ncbi:hypothetical protein AVO45_12940 [Ruegeria marisrubri]|uniref:N-acetyltransferase domain-containing protein n=1 Tax=Ruegeria marisrubri TaxID=1685379 RepID=A0A0X3TKD8_9RHOB|nr:GNAT family N-acetyltransferase [Ruegeria marisrubri]KUJ76214.1 hypothetical protein AVO45_12940 [Ruegeria marisrubri]